MLPLLQSILRPRTRQADRWRRRAARSETPEMQHVGLILKQGEYVDPALAKPHELPHDKTENRYKYNYCAFVHDFIQLRLIHTIISKNRPISSSYSHIL